MTPPYETVRQITIFRCFTLVDEDDILPYRKCTIFMENLHENTASHLLRALRQSVH